MAKVQKPAGKKELISKANTTMVVSIAIAGFIVVFALVSSRALLSQRSYQAKVIGEKEKAVKQLDKNKEAVKQLEVTYKAFVDRPDNVIGGNPNGQGDRDGNNAKIVLDALPSKYDFPAFVTSIEKLLAVNNFRPDSIGGQDDEVAQATSKEKKPIEMPFQMSTKVENYARARDFLITTELSIRPIQIKKLSISGGDNGGNIGIDVDGVSYYQKSKGLTIEEKVVK